MTRRHAITIACATLFVAACAGKAPKAPAICDIAALIPPAVCERLAACGDLPKTQVTSCIESLRSDIRPACNKPQASGPHVAVCAATIRKASCKALQSPTPPRGCEFLAQ